MSNRGLVAFSRRRQILHIATHIVVEVAGVHALFVRSEHLLRHDLAVPRRQSWGVCIVTVPHVASVEAVRVVATDILLLRRVLYLLKLDVVSLLGCRGGCLASPVLPVRIDFDL